MNKILENISGTMKKQGDNISGVVKERLFSPMYFYFIIAWIITNWKFVYTFFRMNGEFEIKLEFLTSFYSFNNWIDSILSLGKLFFIPAISAFIAVWWLSKLSEKFYEKNEQFIINKRVIKNKILYTEKVQYAKDQRKIRTAESDKNDIKYNDNKQFNDWYDEERENVIIGEYQFLPSESLYNNDYHAYKQEMDSSPFPPVPAPISF